MFRLAAYAFLSLLASCGPLFAAWEEDYARSTDHMVRARIEQSGSPSLRQLMSATRFEVNKTFKIPNAYAVLRDGVPVIGMTPEFVLLGAYVSEISALNIVENGRWQNCQLAYFAYLRDAYSQMSSASYNGKAVAPLAAPEEFHGSCEGIQEKYPFSGNAKSIRDSMLTKAMLASYLHELGHVFYRHIVPSKAIDASSSVSEQRQFFEIVCHQRQREAAADRFAVHTLIDLGWTDTAFDITIWNMMLATGSIDPSMELLSDHPSPSVRMASALSEARAYYLSNGGSISPEFDALINETVTVQKRIEASLPLFKFSGAEGFRCGG